MLSLLGSPAIASDQLDTLSIIRSRCASGAFRGDSIATPARAAGRARTARAGSSSRLRGTIGTTNPPTHQPQNPKAPQARGPIRHPMIRVVRLSVLCFTGRLVAIGFGHVVCFRRRIRKNIAVDFWRLVGKNFGSSGVRGTPRARTLRRALPRDTLLGLPAALEEDGEAEDGDAAGPG